MLQLYCQFSNIEHMNVVENMLTVGHRSDETIDEFGKRGKEGEGRIRIIGCYLQSAGLTPFSTPFALATPNK